MANTSETPQSDSADSNLFQASNLRSLTQETRARSGSLASLQGLSVDVCEDIQPGDLVDLFDFIVATIFSAGIIQGSKIEFDSSCKRYNDSENENHNVKNFITLGQTLRTALIKEIVQNIVSNQSDLTSMKGVGKLIRDFWMFYTNKKSLKEVSYLGLKEKNSKKKFFKWVEAQFSNTNKIQLFVLHFILMHICRDQSFSISAVLEKNSEPNPQESVKNQSPVYSLSFKRHQKSQKEELPFLNFLITSASSVSPNQTPEVNPAQILFQLVNQFDPNVRVETSREAKVTTSNESKEVKVQVGQKDEARDIEEHHGTPQSGNDDADNVSGQENISRSDNSDSVVAANPVSETISKHDSMVNTVALSTDENRPNPDHEGISDTEVSVDAAAIGSEEDNEKDRDSDVKEGNEDDTSGVTAVDAETTGSKDQQEETQKPRAEEVKNPTPSDDNMPVEAAASESKEGNEKVGVSSVEDQRDNDVSDSEQISDGPLEAGGSKSEDEKDKTEEVQTPNPEEVEIPNSSQKNNKDYLDNKKDETPATNNEEAKSPTHLNNEKSKEKNQSSPINNFSNQNSSLVTNLKNYLKSKWYGEGVPWFKRVLGAIARFFKRRWSGGAKKDFSTQSIAVVVEFIKNSYPANSSQVKDNVDLSEDFKEKHTELLKGYMHQHYAKKVALLKSASTESQVKPKLETHVKYYGARLYKCLPQPETKSTALDADQADFASKVIEALK